MKTIKLIMVVGSLTFFSLLTLGCANKPVQAQDIQEYALEISNEEDVVLDWKALESNGKIVNDRLRLFFIELRDTHITLQATRNNVKNLYADLINMREQFQATNQRLTDDDYNNIVKAIQSIRINKYMLQQTIGQGYQQLSLVKQNHLDYDNETIKTMLTQAYITFEARIQIYEDMYESMNSIITILDNYMET